MGRRAIVAGALVMMLASIVFWALDRRDRNLPEKRDSETTNAEVERQPRRNLNLAAAIPSAGAAEEAFGARLGRLLKDEAAQESFRLNSEELALYLERNGTNASSLLVAFETSRDEDFIRRAGEAFPNDPAVQAKVLAHDVFPEARGEWIARFKESAPENSFPHLLAAQELMKTGDVNGALAEVAGMRGKRYEDYTRERMAGLEESYVLAGRPIAEAKAFASSDLLLPQLAPIKKLGMDLRDAANRYAQEGDTAAQAALLQGTWLVGAQLRQSGERSVLLNELVGLAIQNIGLGTWPEGMSAPFIERPISEERTQNAQFRQGVRASSAMWEKWQAQASENEVIAYYDRMRTFGERNAMEWLKRLHPELSPQGTVVAEK